MTFWARVSSSSSCFILKSRLSLSSSCLVARNNHSRFRGGFFAADVQHYHVSSKREQAKRTERVPDKRNLLQIAILGPPNAGKSTLFNRFLDKESNKAYRLKSEPRKRTPSNYEGGNAIVSTVPGTTRDCREGIGRIGTCYFWMMDTAGVNGERLEQHVAVVADKKSNHNRKVTVHHDEYSNTRANTNNNSAEDGEVRRRMVHVMMRQALLAARQADIIFVMFDARQTGVTSDILEICRYLRKEERGGGENNNKHNSNSGKVFLLANKLENEHHWDSKDSPVHEHLAEAARTGFEVLSISAKHGDGMADIANVIEELYLERQQQLQNVVDDDDTILSTQEEADQDIDDDNDDDEEEEEKPLQLAILGRPNVGKSTLVNALLKRERVLTGPTPGLTRDAISIEWSWEGRPVQLVDTAGMIRLHSNYKGGQSNSSSSSSSGSKSIKKVRLASSSSPLSSLNSEFVGQAGEEKRHEMQNIQIQDMAVKDALRAMKMTDVAVLVLDAGAKRLHRRELALAKAVLDEGRALVIAANKMDLVLQKAQHPNHDDDDDDEEEEEEDYDDGSYTKADFARDVRDQLESRFPMLRQTPIVPMSSLTGEGVEDLMPVVFRARDRWARTISTGELNRWLEEVVVVHRQSSVTHETNKIKYIMQTKGRPPTFLLFLNGSSSNISDSSLRFLTRQLQDSFQMYGMDVRLIAKNSSQRDFKPKRKRGGSGLGGHEARKKRTIKLLQTTGSPKKQRRKTKRR